MSCPNCPGPHVPHHCKKVSTLQDQIAALRATFRQGGRRNQAHVVRRLRRPTASSEQLQAGVLSVARTTGVRLLPRALDTTQERKNLDDAESTIDDGQSVLSEDSRATPLDSSCVLKHSSTATRYRWLTAGIDSLKKQNMWEAYEKPQPGQELATCHLQLLQDTGTLGDMVKAKFFAAAEDVEIEEACECDMDDPLSMLAGMGVDTYKVTLFSEVSVAGTHPTCPSFDLVMTTAPAVAHGTRAEAVRYLWSEKGVASLRGQGRWKEYGSPVAGHELSIAHVQSLRGSGKLTAMVKANYFIDVGECCDDWEPPCMTCPKCDVWRVAASLS